MHSKSNQHGSVTVLAMVSLLIMTSLAGVYFNKNISGLSKTFSFNLSIKLIKNSPHLIIRFVNLNEN